MATNVTPFSIVAGPALVYIAPVGTAFPGIEEAPAAGRPREVEKRR